MGFFDKLGELGKGLMADAERMAGRITSKDTLERVCQAAFLVGRADGDFGSAEKAMLVKVIAAKLPHFDSRDIVAAVTRAEVDLQFSVDGGIQILLASIGRAKGSDQAQLVMLVVLAIANADGNFDDAEKKIAGEICDALGLDRSGYGL